MSNELSPEKQSLFRMIVFLATSIHGLLLVLVGLLLYDSSVVNVPDLEQATIILGLYLPIIVSMIIAGLVFDKRLGPISGLILWIISGMVSSSFSQHGTTEFLVGPYVYAGWSSVLLLNFSGLVLGVVAFIVTKRMTTKIDEQGE